MNAAARATLIALALLAPPSVVAAAPQPPAVAILDAGVAAGGTTQRLELLTLKRIFSTIGIPADVVTAADRLAGYRLACCAGSLTNLLVSQDLSDALYDYVETGGILVSAGEAGSALFPLFGVTGQAPSRKRYRLAFGGKDPATSLLVHPNERTISFGNGEKHLFDEVIWTQGARPSADTAAIGTFEDGTAGLTVHPYGRGRAYLLGASFADTVLLPQVGGSYGAERQYANGFEPSADVIMLILKALVQAGPGPTVSLATIPYARAAGLVLTHDVDAQSSFVDSLKFSALEEKYNAKSTFFVTTKYFTDATDIGYFEVPANQNAVRELARRGWNIGSHTVSHLVDLANAPEGDTRVTQKTYDPVHHLTVQGEVRVSKEMLDRTIPEQKTVTYRSGGLVFPKQLVRVLEATGYLYDSTYSANAVLTSFPYFAFEEQEMGSRESSIIEIPVTLDDSRGFLASDTVEKVVGQWVAVLDATARYGGLTVLLMHPSDTRTTTYKLQAQEALMKAVVSRGGWMGDLKAAGEFWRNRAGLGFATEMGSGGALLIRIDENASNLDPAIGFEVTGQVASVSVVDRRGAALDFSATNRDGRIFLGRRR